MAKLSIFALVSLAGYDLKLITDDANSKNSNDSSPQPIKPQANMAQNPISTTPPSASTYTTNATNVIQNSRHLITQTSNEKSNFKSYVSFPNERRSSETSSQTSIGDKYVEKQNIISNKKYTISGQAKNVVVRKILDKLLTEFIANKLSVDAENEVSLVLSSELSTSYVN